MRLKIDEHKIHISKKEIDLLSYSADAGFYRIKPRGVCFPEDTSQVQKLINIARAEKTSICFRAAGTSLSGQSVSEGIIADISRHWKEFEILDNGNYVKCQPGIVGGRVNQSLLKYGRKLGPDPASIHSCMIGGIVSNNSSGMCSGINANPFNTVNSLKYILPNGLEIDSVVKNADAKLKSSAPDIYNGLTEIKSEIEANTGLKQEISDKYEIKTTIGYSLNAFTEYSRPIDILTRLMIGSEGTLGFISEATFKTVPEYPHKLTGLLFFESIDEACSAIPVIRATGCAALELMDRTSLSCADSLNEIAGLIPDLPDNAAALLVEYSEAKLSELKVKESEFRKLIPGLNLINSPEFTSDTTRRNTIWSVRQGLLPLLGKTRPAGTTLIIEDLAFRIDRLGEAISGLHGLFKKYKYENAAVYGHGMDGNIHFIISQRFNGRSQISRYSAFINELAEHVFSLGGTLKAEHGTGRNMAPYVEMEWGAEAYDIMKRIKQLIDPDNLFNPGVIINDDDEVHLKNIKQYPEVNPLIDQCIECGFCEPVCPSRDLTLTPRKRIRVLREINEKRNINGNKLEEIKQDFEYSGIDTCAVDGLCGQKCPLDIDTGAMVKKLRIKKKNRLSNQIASFVSSQFGLFESMVKSLIRFNQEIQEIFGPKLLTSISRVFELISGKTLPKWNKYIRKPSPEIQYNPQNFDAVYFPCCVSRLMGSSDNDNRSSIIQIMLNVSGKAGYKICIPKDVGDHCCGMAFSSKGYREAYISSLQKTITAFWHWSEKGRYPIVLDSTSCTLTMRNCKADLEGKFLEMWRNMTILDSIEYIHDYLLPNLYIKPIKDNVVIHKTCSGEKLGINDKLESIARECSHNVITPESNGCCGFAGDRGFLFPELTKSASNDEAKEVKQTSGDIFISSNISCEIGMENATEKHYESFLYLVDKATVIQGRTEKN